jgi:hypothetical protein
MGYVGRGIPTVIFNDFEIYVDLYYILFNDILYLR